MSFKEASFEIDLRMVTLNYFFFFLTFFVLRTCFNEFLLLVDLAWINKVLSEMRLKNLLCSKTSRFIRKINLISLSLSPFSSHALVSLVLFNHLSLIAKNQPEIN